MARANYENILYSRQLTSFDFNWDSLVVPNLYSYIWPSAIYEINKIVKSIKYDSQFTLKSKLIDNILANFGFVRMHMGTNRASYRHLEDTRIILKSVISRAAINDNIDEYQNQQFLLPFVTKIFQPSECGTVALVERVDPITSIKEFYSIANDVFELLTKHILGRYVLEDIGTDAPMNYGIRKGFGPVLLDFPYAFELDGAKLRCNAGVYIDSTYQICGGEIDYDSGFNNLVCKKCARTYRARDLKKDITNNVVIVEGDSNIMRKVSIIKDGKVICESTPATESIVGSKREFNNLVGKREFSRKDTKTPTPRIVRDDEPRKEPEEKPEPAKKEPEVTTQTKPEVKQGTNNHQVITKTLLDDF